MGRRRFRSGVLVAAAIVGAAAGIRMWSRPPTRGDIPSQESVHNDAAFVQRVFKWSLDQDLNLPVERIEKIRESLRPAEIDSISTAVHALQLFGPRLEIAGKGTASPVRCLDVLMDVEAFRRAIGEGRSLVRTRQGVRVPDLRIDRLATPQAGSQSHHGQVLATLARLGVPLDATLNLGDGHPATVKDMLNDLVANFQLDGEVYWDVLAVAVYLAPRGAWTNRFGRSFSFNDVAARIVDTDLIESPCAGTHALTTLTLLLRIDAERPIFSASGRRHVDSYLRGKFDRAIATQDPAGRWGTLWHIEHPARLRSARYGAATGDTSQLLATGHILEWLLLCPEAWLEPHADAVQRGAEALFEMLRSATLESLWEDYCPATHAANALAVLARLPASEEPTVIAMVDELAKKEGPAAVHTRRDSD